MSQELVLRGGGIEERRVLVAEAVAGLLPKGHAIHGYSSGDSTRVIKILQTKEYSDRAPLLGYGEDGSAERALARALITYALREQQGMDQIKARQFAESTQGQFTFNRNVSRFDNIVWGGDFTLFQDGAKFVASSRYGGGFGMSPLEVRAEEPLAAIVQLTDEYEFMNPRVKLLPALSLE